MFYLLHLCMQGVVPSVSNPTIFNPNNPGTSNTMANSPPAMVTSNSGMYRSEGTWNDPPMLTQKKVRLWWCLVEPDLPRKGQPPYKGNSSGPLPH